jgi:hypothetical protein
MVYQAVRLWWLCNRNLPWLSNLRKTSKTKYRSKLNQLIASVRLEHLSYGFWMTYVKNWNTWNDAPRSLKPIFKSAFQYLSAPKFYRPVLLAPPPKRLSYVTTHYLSTQTVNWRTPDLRLLTLNGAISQYYSHLFLVHGYLFVLQIKPFVRPPSPESWHVNEPSCYVGLYFINRGQLDNVLDFPFQNFSDYPETSTTHFLNVDFGLSLKHPSSEEKKFTELSFFETFGYQPEGDVTYRINNVDQSGETNFMDMPWRFFISPNTNEWLHSDGYLNIVLRMTLNEKVDFSDH